LGSDWLVLVPTGDWTKEREGAQSVQIAHNDDKRQLTTVLTMTAAGDYLPPQLFYQGKTPKCHPQVTVGMCGTSIIVGTMK